MIIRKAKLSDAEIIAKNNLDLAKEIENLQLNYKEAVAGSKALIENDEKGFYLVAEENNEIAGQMLITFEWSDWRNKNIWWLHRIFIKDKWRRKGIFRKMLRVITEMTLKEIVFVIRLYVLQNNSKAIRIYESVGMEKTPFVIY